MSTLNLSCHHLATILTHSHFFSFFLQNTLLENFYLCLHQKFLSSFSLQSISSQILNHFQSTAAFTINLASFLYVAWTSFMAVHHWEHKRRENKLNSNFITDLIYSFKINSYFLTAWNNIYHKMYFSVQERKKERPSNCSPAFTHFHSLCMYMGTFNEHFLNFSSHT